MIQFNSQNTFKEIHYDGHDIKYAYGGCSGDLVWEKQSPTPTFDGRYKLTLDDSSVVYGGCNEFSSITKSEVSGYSASCVSIEIGNCCDWIDGFAFGGFKYALTVVIPSNVARILYDAFNGCIRLASVTVESTTPPFIESGAFANTNNCPIYVPANSVNTYKSASGWSNYALRIQPIPT